MEATGEERQVEQRDVERALGLVFRHLARRERSVAEVRRHLEDRQVDPAAIEAAIAEVAEQGYLDDAGFARRFAEDRRTLDGWGAERIARRLTEAGVAREHVEAALAGHDAQDELEAAIALLRRRVPTPPANDRERQRALGFLVRRGYALEVAHDAVRRHERTPWADD